VSKDGQRIAFIDHPTPADDSGSIAIVGTDGKHRILSAGWASAQGVSWTPSGSEVWFTAARSGNARALHAVDLDGRSRVVRTGIARLRLHDISPDGRVLVTAESTRVGIMALPPGEPRERDLSWLDWSIARDVSDDGRLLLFNESGEGGGAHYGVYLRAMDGAPAVRLLDGSGIAISPDGRWVLATRPSAASPPSGLLAVPTGAGEIISLPRGPARYQQWGTWFPDGRRVLFAGNESDGATRLYVQGIDGEPPKAITPEGVYLTSSQPLSPDGSTIAAVAPDDVPTLFPVNGGPSRPVPSGRPGDVPIHWAGDRSVYLWQRGQAPAEVFRVDLDTGVRQLWKVLMPADPTGVHEILRIAFSRDGSSYAYSYTRELATLHVASGVK
jgi:Tol biopolymer transport system component